MNRTEVITTIIFGVIICGGVYVFTTLPNSHDYSAKDEVQTYLCTASITATNLPYPSYPLLNGTSTIAQCINFNQAWNVGVVDPAFSSAIGISVILVLIAVVVLALVIMYLSMDKHQRM